MIPSRLLKKTLRHLNAHTNIKEFFPCHLNDSSSFSPSFFLSLLDFHTRCRGEERGLSRKHIIESVQASLKRLQLDYIDVVIIHKADSMCPMEGNFASDAQHMCFKLKLAFAEVVRAMNYVINKGWVMYWGRSGVNLIPLITSRFKNTLQAAQNGRQPR